MAVNRSSPPNTNTAHSNAWRQVAHFFRDIPFEPVLKVVVGRTQEKVAEAHGRLDVLVNNAGITRDGLFLRMDDKDFDDVIQTNLKSAFVATRTAARSIMRSKSGRIINISSVAGVMGNEQLYRRLLAMFRDRETGFAVRFRTAYDAGDTSAAIRLAHDLKSTSGTLGAQSISDAAEALELACANGNLADVEVRLSALSHELNPVIAGLSTLEGPSSGASA